MRLLLEKCRQVFRDDALAEYEVPGFLQTVAPSAARVAV